MVTGSYHSGTPVEFKYDRKIHKYVRYIDGVRQHAADGRLVSAPQRDRAVLPRRRAPAPTPTCIGNPSQFTYTVGYGGVQVFRYGKRITGTWSRHKLSQPTAYKALNGKRIPLAPGNTWVVLIRKGIPVSS